MFKKTDKPWGYELEFAPYGEWRMKILVVNKGHQTSKQYHMEAIEYHFHLDGTVQYIPPRMVHRLVGPITVLELKNGHDNDIVRIKDDYGREG